ncbi:hypothetical protein OAU13_00970 [bacterium]|nr:hypothetical protein [bacterium]
MANGFLTTTELDFQNYKANLKTFLTQQDVFKDYDFEGSNLAVLLDLLAYNTYMNGVYLNMVGSEMFLDTAQLRESIVSHAKELNYTPRSRTAPIAFVDITITPSDNPDSITIPKYYEINGRTEDNTTYYFTTDEAIVIRANNGVYKAANVAVYEGNIIKEVFIANTSTRYLLQSANVDIQSVSVTVRDSQSATEEVKWNRETFLFGLNNTDNIYFIQGAEDHLFEVVFGNGDIGKALVDGNVVTISYRETNGAEANGVEQFTAPNAVQGYTDVLIGTVQGSASGAEHETDEEIKFNAPRYFPTQNRAVTVEDFIALTKQAFPSLEVVTAYGGEETEPKQYGKVIVAAKPFGGTKLSTPLKSQIYNYLKERSSISIDPVVVDPDYFFAEVVTEVLYNINLTTRSERDIQALVEDTIIQWGANNLAKFGSDLRYSKLIKDIDASDDAIISNNTQLRIIKHVEVDTGVPFRISFSFDNQLKQEPTTVRKIDDNPSTIESSLFTYTLNNIDYISKIRDDGLGNLMVLSTVNGVVQVLRDKVGTINYNTGELTIGELVYEDVGVEGVLEIYAKTKKLDLETRANKILQLEAQHLVVTVNGIRE